MVVFCSGFAWLSLHRGAVGVCWELRSGSLPSRGDSGSVEVCGVVPVAGGAGRDLEMASPSSSSPGLGKMPPRRVSTGPWESVQTCVSSCTWACEQAFLRAQSWDDVAQSQKAGVFSAGRPLLFLPLCIPILLASGTGFTSSLSLGSSTCIESCPRRLAVCLLTCSFYLCPGTQPLPVPVPCSLLPSPCRAMPLSRCRLSGVRRFPGAWVAWPRVSWHH